MAKSSALEPQVLRRGEPLDEWDRFVDESPQGSLFCRSWWLEAVCPNGFEILTLRRNNRIVAGMPIVRYRKYGLEAIHMPKLTQTLGVLLAPPEAERYEARLTNEMGVLKALVKAIPRVAHFNAFCHYTVTNWLPFYWAGYKQTTRYTYVIEDLGNLEAVFANFSHEKRKNLKKAEKLVTVRTDLPTRDFYDFHAMTLRKQGEVIWYDLALFQRLHDAATQHDAGRIWHAVDAEGNLHAAHFVLFDRKSAYYLISAIDPDRRRSCAATLLLKQTIADLEPHTKAFDFEGSMIEGVELSARQFGAVQKPYFHLSQNNLPLWVRAGLALKAEFAGWLRKLRPKKPARPSAEEDVTGPKTAMKVEAAEAPDRFSAQENRETP